MKIIEFEEILSCIPHRPPSLLIDRAEVLPSAQSGKGYYNRSLTQFGPICSSGGQELPLSFLMEGIFQTAGVIRRNLSIPTSSSEKLLTGLNFVRYSGKVFANDAIHFEVVFQRISKLTDQFRGTIFSGGKPVLICEASSGGKLFK